MSIQNTLLQNSISLGKISKSFESFGKGLASATQTSVSIAKNLDQGNRKKEQAILKKREIFDKRREAVERKERESVIEAGQVTSLSSNAFRTITGSTKGFLGRVMDFVGTILIGWLVTNLPTIIKNARKLITRIQKATSYLNDWFNGIGEFFGSFNQELNATTKSITGASLFEMSPEKRLFDENATKVETGLNRVVADYNKFAETFKNFDIVEEIKKILGIQDDKGKGDNSGTNTTPGSSGGGGGGASETTKGSYGKVLNATELTKLARSVGMPEDKIPTMVAIALSESGGDSSADTVKSGLDPDKKNEFSLGLWQINMIDKPGLMLGEERRRKLGLSKTEELYDPVTNAKAALYILNSQGLNAWSVYDNGKGKYLNNLPAAKDAYESLKPNKTNDNTNPQPQSIPVDPYTPTEPIKKEAKEPPKKVQEPIGDALDSITDISDPIPGASNDENLSSNSNPSTSDLISKPPSKDIAQTLNKPKKQPQIIDAGGGNSTPPTPAPMIASSGGGSKINIPTSNTGLNISDILLHELAQV